MSLSRVARRQIRESGLTIAAYIRDWCPDDRWLGDSCGCPDDRCIGYHHDENEECSCLDVTIAEVAAKAVAS